jgi:ribose 5-phosphate isomerase A
MKCEYLHVSRHVLKRSIAPASWKDCTLNLTATQIEFVKMDVKQGKRNSTEGVEVKTAYGSGVAYKKQISRLYAAIELSAIDKLELESPPKKGEDGEEDAQFGIDTAKGSDWPHVSVRMASAEMVQQMIDDINHNLSNRTWEGRKVRSSTTRNRSMSGYRGTANSVSTGSRRMTAGGHNSSLLSFSQTEATPQVGDAAGRALQNRLEKQMDVGSTGFAHEQGPGEVAAANPMRAAAESGAALASAALDGGEASRSRAMSSSLDFAKKKPGARSAPHIKGRSRGKSNAGRPNTRPVSHTLASVQEAGVLPGAGGGSPFSIEEGGEEGEVHEESAENLQRQCGYKAIDQFVKSNMVVGLGAAGVASYACERLGENIASGVLKGITVVPMSNAAEEHARRLGMTLGDLDSHPDVDVAIDGADEIDDELDVIRCMDGALLRSKMVVSMAKQFVVVVDEPAYSPQLTARRQIPVEVSPYCAEHTRRRLLAIRSVQGCGCTAKLRKKESGDELYKSESGNHVVDLTILYGEIDKELVGVEINSLSGVVEHGLFVGKASAVIIAGAVVGGVKVKVVDEPSNGSPDKYRFT